VNVLMLLIFIGAAVVSLFVVLFLWSARSDTFGQGDRLALLPLMDDECVAPASTTDATLAPDGVEVRISCEDSSGTALE
jgi:nitrogen fixation-related uncharacterized protein